MPFCGSEDAAHAACGFHVGCAKDKSATPPQWTPSALATPTLVVLVRIGAEITLRATVEVLDALGSWTERLREKSVREECWVNGNHDNGRKRRAPRPEAVAARTGCSVPPGCSSFPAWSSVVSVDRGSDVSVEVYVVLTGSSGADEGWL